MKFLISIILGLTAMFPLAGGNYHGELGRLWDEYGQFDRADRPEDKKAVLKQIKRLAAEQRSAWDYYDACRKYVQTSVSQDWRERDALLDSLDREIAEFDCPVMTFVHRFRSADPAEALAFIERERSGLESGANVRFYGEDSGLQRLECAEMLRSLLENDYDYALWAVYSTSPDSVSDILAERVEGRYPFDFIYRLCEAGREAQDGSGPAAADSVYRELAESYPGRAAALYAESKLLENRFRTLQDGGTSDEDGYLALLTECAGLQSRIKAASRSRDRAERLIAAHTTYPETLTQILTGRHIRLDVENDTLLVQLVNLGAAKVEVRHDGKSVLRTRLSNPGRSFFVPDTLEVPLGSLEDGSYAITARKGRISGNLHYDKFSLSIAINIHSAGAQAYICDYWSGEPCGEAVLTLRNSGVETASCTLAPGEGFRPVPEKFLSGIRERDYTYTVQASLTDGDGRTRMSPEVPLYGYPQEGSGTAPSAYSPDRCMIITDRSAFNPGETVHFKAVLFSGTERLRAAEEGVGLRAAVTDARGEEFSSLELRTNSFGSVAGSFEIEEGRTGGMYTVRISKDGHTLASKSIRVDEFTLPSFTVEWDDDPRLFLCGDSPTVSGRIRSFSGHGLLTSKARYEVLKYGKPVCGGALEIDRDGRFSLAFDTDHDGYGAWYAVRLDISDESGESLSFEKGVSVAGRLDLGMAVMNRAEGSFSLAPDRAAEDAIICGSVLDMQFSLGHLRQGGGSRPELAVGYSIADSRGTEVLTGQGGAGRTEIALEGLPSGLYRLMCSATAIADDGTEYEDKAEMQFILMSEDDTVLGAPVLGFFRSVAEDRPVIQIGSGQGELWAVVQLYGNGNVLLDSRTVHLEGIPGEEGSLATVDFGHDAAWPSRLSIGAIFFKHAGVFRYTDTFTLPEQPAALPLSLERFTDTAAPSSEITVNIKTDPAVECAASVFDLASESIAANIWREILPTARHYPDFICITAEGTHDSSGRYFLQNGINLRGLAVPKVAGSVMADAAFTESASAEDYGAGAQETALPEIRTDFEGTLAWEPLLRSGEDGTVSFSFETSDRISTYVVQLFAHDRDMDNAVLRDELLVTLPVRVNIAQPKFLYSSDIYSASVTVTSNCGIDTPGRLSISFIDGQDYGDKGKILDSLAVDLSVPARGGAARSLSITVPDIRTLGILASFVSEDGNSDAVFVTIPVRTPVQTVTEAHSALLKDDASRKDVADSLLRAFKNGNPADARMSELSIMQMLLRDLPGKYIPESDNLTDLLGALYADCLDSRLRAMPAFSKLSGAAPREGLDDAEKAALIDKILSCRNADGGFGWFDGLPSSPGITAVLLEWCADMGDDCPKRLKGVLPDAVDYLDRVFLSSPAPYGRGGFDLARYLHTRSLYPDLPVEFGNCGKEATDAFRGSIGEYLTPTGDRGLASRIIQKAMRIQTSGALLRAGSGAAFCRSAGIRTGAELRGSLEADLESLLQYSQPQVSGGYCYPNAAVPGRGLFDGSLYAHSMLCDLLSEYGHDDIAEGIRLWIMVQKETQHFESDFAYLKAVSSVMDGSEATLSARVLTFSLTDALPFGQISEAGNGMNIKASYSLDGKPLEDGMLLKTGDRITAEYEIWSEESRSFVRAGLPHWAALQAVDQLSGPASYSYGTYREVRAGRIDYWFDELPEGKTVLREEFHVSQEGVFHSGAPTAESCYAPHYRANDSCPFPLRVR